MGRGLEGGKQRGISLVELIMFIVIVSVALAGILLVMNVTTKNSADPIIHKQALAIAESLLEEVELMPFTYCDPDDPTAATATSATVGAGACTVQVENIGLEAAFAPYQPTAETRYHTTTPFDNVNDYHSFAMNGGAIYDITDGVTPIPGVGSYKLKPITVASIDMPPITAASGDALLITVTVTGPDGVDVVVEGVRTRYAPRTTP
jgi:MSHA pilin protein MshD